MIGTSRPPNVEPSQVTRMVRARAGVHRNSGWRVAASRHRPRTIMLRTGLAVLMCLTTWVVASVSAWMVPLYLALMALIFVTPRNQHQLPVLSKRRANLVSNEEASSDRRLSIASAGEADILQLADCPIAEAATDESAVDVTSSAPDPVGASPVKQLRGRTRTRKTGKSAAETASVLPPVAWVRVGPGKFVRADIATHPIDQVQPHAQSDLCVAGASPAADSGARMLPVSMDTAQAVEEQQNCGPLDTTDSNPGAVVVSDENVLGSATEEHGIAPSAPGPISTISTPPDPLDHEVPGAVVGPPVDPVPVASRSGKASDRDLGFERPWSQDKRSRSRARRVLRGFTSAIPGADQTCRRRTVGYGCKLRTSVWSSIGPKRLPQQSAAPCLRAGCAPSSRIRTAVTASLEGMTSLKGSASHRRS